jgi:hypothetical protein
MWGDSFDSHFSKDFKTFKLILSTKKSGILGIKNFKLNKFKIKLR